MNYRDILFTMSPACPPAASRWLPPPPDWFKINFDAGLRSNAAAAAVVARDHLGNILYSLQMSLLFRRLRPFFLLLVLLSGLAGPCVFEGDLLLVVNCFKPVPEIPWTH